MSTSASGLSAPRALLNWRTSSAENRAEFLRRLSQGRVKIVIRMIADEEISSQYVAEEPYLPQSSTSEHWGKIPITPEGTEAYSFFERTENFARLRLQMLSMQNRNDFTGTFRVLEREIQLRERLLRIFSAVLEGKPNFAIFDVTPHDHVAAAVEGVLRWQGIPILFFQPSLVGPQSIPRTSLTDTFDFSISRELRQEYQRELSQIVSLAQASIERLEKGAGTAKISSQKQREISARTPIGRFRSLMFMLSRLTKGTQFPSESFTGHTVLPGWLTKPLEVILDWSLRRSLVSTIFSIPSEIPETQGRFALFALHYEPERCSIPEGYPYSSQIDAVIRARALLSDDIVLVVKEHFSQSAAALRGTLGRSPETYTMLEGIPGVKVLGIKANTPKLITRAECVFTLTGKVGIEAALKGTPVVYGGQPWWGQMPGVAALSSFDDNSALADFLASPRPSRDEVFGWLSDRFANTLVPVLGDATVERYSERISPLPERFAELQLEVVLEVIDSFLEREVGRKST